ncbi:MAG: phage head closure protein [Desulfovibrio sp.]|nr:phage head closure protein [Desulfovibrio sp.]
MLVSKLRHQIEIFACVEHQNDYGEIVNTWESIGVFWAEVRSVPGEEFRENVFTFSKVPYRIVIRYREGLNAMMKIRNLTDGQLFDVEAMRDPDGKREILELQCLWREDQQNPF